MNSLRQAAQQAPAEHPDHRRLAVHRDIEHVEHAAEILDDPLQAEADAENREMRARPGDRASRAIAKSAGRPGPGDSTTRSGRSPCRSSMRAEIRAHRRDFGAGGANVAGERVDERILVIDQQHLPAAPGGIDRRRRLPQPLGSARSRRTARTPSIGSRLPRLAGRCRTAGWRRRGPRPCRPSCASCAGSGRCSCCRRR